MTTTISRRQFIRVSATAAGGLLIAAQLPACGGSKNLQADSGDFSPNAFLTFSEQGEITFTLPRAEMGQGTYTGLTTIIAEELEVDPQAIAILFAPADKAYNNPDYYNQMTGGSNSIKVHFSPLSQLGADTRQLFINAAAERLQVSPGECEASNALVTHTPSGRQLPYRDLLTLAATLDGVESTPLKKPAQYKYIGKQRQRLDAAAKTFGQAEFAIDVAIDNMLVAAIARPPVFGGKLIRFDASSAETMPGVHHVLAVDAGVAVVADNYWQAQQALQAVIIEWDHGKLAGLSSDSLFQHYRDAADADTGDKVRRDGNASKALAFASKVIEAEYTVPFLAHATMEPQNCVAHVQADRCDIWVPTQGPDLATVIASNITGLSHDQIHIHSSFLGGGFGRRILHDYLAEAVSISSAIGQPVKVIWSREDDIAHDSFRPATYNRLKAGLNEEGELLAWQHQIVGPSIMRQFIPNMLGAHVPEAMPDALVRFLGKTAGKAMGTVIADGSCTEGADDLPYSIPNLDVRYVHVDAGVPLLYWRSVGHSQNAFMVESFLDEAAHAAGSDPYQFRVGLLKEDPRRRAVLDKAAELGNWGNPAAGNRFQGIAVHKSFGSYVAQVAEIEIINEQIQVKHISCVVDCGLVVNPDIVRMQMESGVIFGLTAALYGEITHRDGRVEQSNFHDYPLLRMNETPTISVHIMESDEAPSGVGEPGVPPVLPAVANAVFAATGQRLRKAPLRLGQAQG